MTQLAEKQKQSIDTLQNDQFELAKIRKIERHGPKPQFTYEQDDYAEGIDQISGAAYLKDGDDEYEALVFYFSDDGKLRWTDKQGTGKHRAENSDAISFVIARENGEVERLGMEGKPAGKIDDFSVKDQLYILHDSAIDAITTISELSKSDLSAIAENDDFSTDVVRVSMDGEPKGVRVQQGEPTKAQLNHASFARRQKEQEEKAQRAEARQNNGTAVQSKPAGMRLTARLSVVEARQRAAAVSKASSTPDVSSPATIPISVTSPSEHNKTYTFTPDAPAVEPHQTDVSHITSSESEGPLMARARLVRNIETYTDKVASYEEIAAEALAKRMKGRLFKPLRRKSQEEDEKFDDTMSKLDRFTMALDNSLMKQMILEGKTDEEAAELLAEHQQARAEARAERNRAELTKGRVASWLDKYANLSTKKKIAFGIGAGAVIAAAGAGLAAAGGVAAVAGGVGLAVAKVGKTYAQKRSEIYKVDKDQVLSPDTEVTDEDGNTTKRSVREQVIAARDHHRDQRETSIHKADRNKKIAVGLATVAGVALGAGIVTKAIEHGDEIRGIIDKKIYFGNPGTPNHTDVSDVPKPIETPEPKLPPKVIEHDFAPSAKTIDLGEGWLQTFNEAGIANVNEQYALLNNQTLMQELANKGLAYRDANIGGWGINMTADGKMPADALKLITDFARRDGYDLAS